MHRAIINQLVEQLIPVKNAFEMHFKYLHIIIYDVE